ncbi:MAG: hypothetical protein V7735_11315 [Photobacterium frigidiphilum]|jgi:hypothetical protein|uniref:hypothetical protein n=1 Tax=Photobacterium frigidiphilum TaxID=264736 RepID=UPI00147627B4|nr:hypothetical protein [Photobacterium frigidiphilum]
MMERKLPHTAQQMFITDILEECDRRLKTAGFELSDLSPEGKTLLFSSAYEHLINEHK